MCLECLRPCELHGITFCLTCHNHPGECSMGGCERSAKGGTVFEFAGGRERRKFCKHHSTHPNFGWLRAGGVPVES